MNRWPSIIALVDMNAFFASIEQLDFPELRARPVAVTNGEIGTCIITCSYEARARGIKTGMRLKEARRRCPNLIQRPARPERYATISKAIMTAINDLTPDVEVFSVDEAFLDLTGCEHLWGTPERMGQLIKSKVFEASGLLCSVGVSGDKTTAKWAAKQNKPNGLTVVPPWEAEARLHDVPVTDLCGINHGIGRFLEERGVTTCGQMKNLPISALAARFGSPGRRIWLMAQGKDPDGLHTDIAPPKSIGHGKVMPPNTQDLGTIRMYLQHMSEKVAFRLRKHDMEASLFQILLRTELGWLGGKYRTSTPVNHGKTIYALADTMLRDEWYGQGVSQVQVTALSPHPVRGQTDLFAPNNERVERLDRALDAINAKFGSFTVAPARLMQRSSMPNVIAPAWKPFGHREHVLGQ